MKRILIIEDNEINLYMMTFMLEKHGYHVLQARDGQSGIELARREQPDLILLDMQLPMIDGYEVARRLRALPETNGIPIMGISSYAMVGDREKALTAGCTGYVEKPIDPVRFMEKIREVFAGFTVDDSKIGDREPDEGVHHEQDSGSR